MRIAVQPEPPPASEAPIEAAPDEPAVTAPSSRARAALDLNQKALGLLEQNQPDAAIDLLERAIAIDPANGPACYYLSRAWLMKGDRQQAYEFNRLAGEYMGEDDDWQERIRQQDLLIQPP